jgi:hypothetical protein
MRWTCGTAALDCFATLAMTKVKERTEEKEGSGTPTDAVSHVAVPAGTAARHEEVGLRRPSAAGALACRRSTTVLP